MMKSSLRGWALALFSTLSISSQAAVERSLCVYDPVGANGDAYAIMKDYSIAAISWGVKFDLKAYTDEKVASENFKAGNCDAVAVTGITARQYNHFTGSIDSIGSIPSYKHLRTVLAILAKPKAASYMRSGKYEVTGILPGGAIYLYVNDRNIDSVSELSGKRIAIFEHDEAQPILVNNVGASMVGSSVANFAGKFNNGAVDVCFAPALAYSALELYKGLGTEGGIIDFPLSQLTIQMVAHADKFPETFGNASREYIYKQYDHTMALINSARESIDGKYWVNISKERQDEYQEMFRQARLDLREKEIYNAKTLSILRAVRCRIDPTAAECTASDKE